MNVEPEPVPLPPRQNSQGERERERVLLLEYSSLPGFCVQLFPIQSCKPWHELSAFFSAPSSSSSAPLSQTPLLLSPFPRTSSCSSRPVSFRRLHPEPKLRPAPTHNPAPPELHLRRPQHLRPAPRAPPAPAPDLRQHRRPPLPQVHLRQHTSVPTVAVRALYLRTYYPRRLEERRRIHLALSFRESPLPRRSRDSGSAERISFRFHGTRIPSFSFFPKIPSFLPLFSPQPGRLLFCE